MTDVLTLEHDDDIADLTVFLQRAKRIGAESVWVQGRGDALTLTVPVVTRDGLLDRSPDVLGLRILQAPQSAGINRVVSVVGMLDRLARGARSFALPLPEIGMPWAGISSPQSGWQQLGELPASMLAQTAHTGIEEIAQANGLGSNIVTTVRKEVWARPISATEIVEDIPAGVSFAALALGFLGPEAEAEMSTEMARVFRSGNWGRLSLQRGHLLWH